MNIAMKSRNKIENIIPRCQVDVSVRGVILVLPSLLQKFEGKK